MSDFGPEIAELQTAIAALPERDQARIAFLANRIRLMALQNGDLGFIALCLACGQMAEAEEKKSQPLALLTNGDGK